MISVEGGRRLANCGAGSFDLPVQLAYDLQWFVSLNRAEAEVRARRSFSLPPICLLIVWLAAATVGQAQQGQDPAPVGQTQRLEGEAILALADAAREGEPVPADFQLQWQNEFLKAQRGTFIPFTLTIDASRLSRPVVLVYVRAVRRERAPAPPRRERGRIPGRPTVSRERREPPPPDEFPVDAIFPAELQLEPGQRARVSRGFSLAAGTYDVFVVVRERVDPAGVQAAPKAAVMTQRLDVPDFTAPGLTTSSIIVADRLETLSRRIEPDELPERPYVIGRNEIVPAADLRFRRNEELIVVFLIYNPFVTSEQKFDLKVEYHFFRRGTGAGDSPRGAEGQPPAQDGERYFNHTDPQRFNPAILGSEFDPATGQPVMAGQGIPMSGFEPGDYRLAVRVMDLLAGKSIMRDVHFTVGP